MIRLRTYGRDGRPDLGNGRIPTHLTIGELQAGAVVDSSDEGAIIRSQGAGIETAAVDNAPPMVREPSTGNLGQRRNTGGRKHSPSTASDRPPMPTRHDTEETMQQLTERFEYIRAETEEAILQVGRDSEEFKVQMAALIKERDEKRQMLKEKEEASEKLKKEVHSSERANRQAQTRKTIKEKALRDKQAERQKMQEDMARWQKDIQDMRKEREIWQKERDKIAESTTKKVEEMKGTLRERQNSLNGMEEEIRVKGLQIKELEEERQNLPGAEDDDEAKEQDAAERLKDLQWDQTERELITRYNQQTSLYRNFESEIHKAQILYTQISARHTSNPVMYHASASGVDYNQTEQRAKARRSRQRKSQPNIISSPAVAYPTTDVDFASTGAFSNNLSSTASPNFAAGPYFDMSADVGPSHALDGINDGDVKAFTDGAPLSPTATALLPSTLFADDELPNPPDAPPESFGPAFFSGLGPSIIDRDASSPELSSRSPSSVSSPQTSMHNLTTFPTSDSDRRSINSPGAEFGVIGSPGPSTVHAHPIRRFGQIGDLFKRGKTLSDEGPALGSLKPGQSQSLPRQADGYSSQVRNRRTSFSTGWSGLQFLNRGGSTGESTEGNAPALARNVARRRRGFNMFGSSGDDPTSVYSDRDPSSPRPASIASSDLPRPSTDSAPFGWPAAEGGAINKNSPLATNWSVGTHHPWSHHMSRRPSNQHSSIALSTGLATEDDGFLPPDVLSQQSSPAPVGVIGTRPHSAMSATPGLNPAAPTFKAMFSRGRTERTDKSDKRKRDSFDGMDERHDEATSPSDSRKSRDGRSIRTQASVSESYDPLDRAVSDTPSELTAPSAASKESKETSFQKLLRKGSSSKFSIGSFRGKDTSLFGGKKGTYSDRNASGERSSSVGDVDEAVEDALTQLGRSMDSVTSSPMTGTPRESRMSVNWGRFSIKKGKEKASSQRQSLEVGERASETEGTEDEGRLEL